MNPPRRSRSVGSPARSTSSVKLSTVIRSQMDSFALSPMPTQRSILSDNTDVEIPTRRSWWKKLDENSREIMDVLTKDPTEANKAIEDYIEVDVLSQERKNVTLDIPDSSDNESIHSIVIQQRRLFTEKENQPINRFGRVINTRESLDKLHKSKVVDDKTLNVGPKNLFNQGTKQRTRQIFPPSLLNTTPNKMVTNKAKDIAPQEVKGQVLSLFGNRPVTKRKNMFADCIMSESEEEILEIQPKVFGFQKNLEAKRRPSVNARGGRAPSPSSIADIDIDDWQLLPSSTMVDHQLEVELRNTPIKRAKVSQESPNTTANKTKTSLTVKDRYGFNNRSNETKNNKNSSQSKTSKALSKIDQVLESDDDDDIALVYDDEVVEEDRGNNTIVENQSQQTSKVTKQSQNVNVQENNTAKIQNKSSIHEDSRQAKKNTSTMKQKEEQKKEKDNETNMDKETAPQNISHNKSPKTRSKSIEPDPQNIEKVSNENPSNTIAKENNLNTDGNDDVESDERSVNAHDKLQDHNKSEQEKSQNVNEVDNRNILKGNEGDKVQRAEYNDSEEVFYNKYVGDNNLNRSKESEVIKQRENESQQNENEEIQDSHKNISQEVYNEDEFQQEDDTESEVENDEEQDTSNQNDSQNDEEIENSNQSLEVEDDENASQDVQDGSGDENDNMDEQDSDVQNESLDEVDNGSGNDSNEMDYDDEDNENNDDLNQSDDKVPNIEENGNTNTTHDTTGRHRKKEGKVSSPEVILHDKTNQNDSLILQGRNTSVRKTKTMIKDFNIKPSIAPHRVSTGPSVENSSAEGSGWDSHRTTRVTMRKTFGKAFTPRKSLRTLVMEKSAKRNTVANATEVEFSRFPQANSTELPGMTMNEEEAEEIQESDHEASRRMRQTTLEMYLQKIKKQDIEKRQKLHEEVRNSLKAPKRDVFDTFKVPAIPKQRRIKPLNTKLKAKPMKKSAISLGTLPPEILEDLKYKPPKRYQPPNASWITKRLYKFLETKLEPKHDYKARIRSEKLVEKIHSFTKEIRRHSVAPLDAVNKLKHEMAQYEIVQTHYDFYQFFHEYMPREVRVKVVPDDINKIPYPRHVFSEILH